MRKLMRYVWLMPALAGLMMSCASEKTDAKALEGAWNIVEVDGEAVKAEAEEAPFIGFDMSEMSVHGKTDCNLFNASFELKPNDCSAVQLGEIITTKDAELRATKVLIDGLENWKAYLVYALEEEMEKPDITKIRTVQ